MDVVSLGAIVAALTQQEACSSMVGCCQRPAAAILADDQPYLGADKLEEGCREVMLWWDLSR